MLSYLRQHVEPCKCSGYKILNETTAVSEETGEIVVCTVTWGGSPLHMAVLQRNKKEVKRLVRCELKQEVDRLHHGLTALHLTVRFNKIELAECLIKAKAQVNKKNDEGETPLYLACSIGNTAMAEFLIKHGADVNITRGTLSSPLFCASSNGHTDLIKMLLKYKVDVEWTNSSGTNALGIAVFNNQKEAVKTLLEAGCNVNTFDKYGRSPLFYGVDGHNKDIVELILKNGGRQFINAPDRSGLYALYLACSRGDYAIIQQLVTAGANVNIMCEDKTPLYVAVQKGYTQIVRCLIQNGARLDMRCEGGNTAIFAAVTHRNVNEDMVRALIRGGCNVDVINMWKNSPVQAAKLHGNSMAGRILLNADADPNLTDMDFILELMVRNPESRDELVQKMSMWKISLNNAKNLKRLCRAVVRSAVGYGYNYQQKIDSLSLPRSVKDFLMFKDV